VNWLSIHFWNLFGGLGASLVAAIVGWLMVRPWRSDAPKGSVEAPMSNASVASGAGNIQAPIQIHGARDVHIGQTAHSTPVVQPPVQAAKPERTPYNIKFIGADVCSLEETVGGGGFIERGSQRNAIIVKFANVPRLDGENKTVTVKAVLIYTEGEGVDRRELLAIPGNWINGDRFQADDLRHKLIVGIVTNRGFTAIEEEEIHAHRRNYSRLQPHQLAGFTSGTVFIRLTSSFASLVLYEGYFTVTKDPLSIVPKSS
jgi:hypothetical protein